FGRDGEPRLDDIHTQLVQLAGEPKLLVDAHRETGRLFAVAERGVEDDDGMFCHAGLQRKPPGTRGTAERPAATGLVRNHSRPRGFTTSQIYNHYESIMGYYSALRPRPPHLPGANRHGSG